MDYYVTKLFSNANEERNQMTGVAQARTKFKKKERERERTKAGKRRRLTTICLKSFVVAKRQFDKATAPGQLGGSVWRWNMNDALRIVTGCLRPTPTDHLPVLSGIQPAELRLMGTTLFLAYRGSLDPDHILYGLLSGFSDTRQVRLRSRRPFVPGARNLLDNLARLGIRASEWTNHKWNVEYCENASRFRAFVPGTGARPVGMGLPRAAWVKLNRLQTDVGRFYSSMHKWGLAPSPNCECGASEQTADHVLTACPIHRAPHGARGLTVLDDET